jgi:RNAse (barnase) inhibitor barstar
MPGSSPTSFEYVSDLTGFRALDWRLVRFTGRLRHKQDLLRALASGLKFPDYFGWNWDALDECLCDLSWLNAPAGVVLLHKYLPLVNKEQRQIYFDILRHAQAQQKIPLRIVLPQSAAEQSLL